MRKTRIMIQQCNSAETILINDIINQKYNNIQILHEMVDPDYSKLLRRRYKNKNIFSYKYSNEQLIFFDIVSIILEGFKENEVVRKRFIQLYEPFYLDNAKDVIQRVEERGVDERLLTPPKDLDSMLPLSYAHVVLGEIKELEDSPIWDTIAKSNVEEAYDFREQELKENAKISFPRENKSVIESRAFKNYVNRNRVCLSKFLGCKEDELATEINALVIEDLNPKYIIDNGFAMVRPSINKKLMLASHKISYIGFENALFQCEGEEISSHRLVDVDRVINDYYISKAIKECLVKGEEFTKIYLAQECITKNPENDLEEILELYTMDVLCRMYNSLMDAYYETFSWDRLTNIDKNTIHKNTIRKLEEENDSLRIKLDAISKENTSLKILNVKDTNQVLYEYESENNKLRKELEELQDKTNRQNIFIKSQNELIEELQKKSPIDESSKFDFSILKNKKYLFLCKYEKMISEFQELFPNSKFMKNATKDISSIDCDCVVVLTRYISHSMYHKVKQNSAYKDKQYIMCNSTSTNSIMKEMCQALTKNK